MGIAPHALAVPDQDKHPPGPGDSHVHPPPIFKEAYFPFFIRPHQRYDDALFLSALDAVHCRNVWQRSVRLLD